MNRSTAKYVTLCLLVLQNSLLILTLRYSRTASTEGPKYLSSCVVLVAEILKFFTSAAMLLYHAKFSIKEFLNDAHSATVGHPADFMKIAVPSGIYAIQNNLLFVALTYLDAATFQVTYQLKILTTAFFAVTLLKTSLSAQQWGSLFFLMVGVAMVQFPTDEVSKEIVWYNHLYGVIIICIASVSSGFAGVYFELLLKKQKYSLWLRNLQMSSFGIVFATIQMLWIDGEAVLKDGMLQGFDKIVVAVLLLQAYGGLLVAFVVQYTDNIIKGFTTSISILVSYFLSYMVLNDIEPTLLFTCGAGLVVASTFLYGHKGTRAKAG